MSTYSDIKRKLQEICHNSTDVFHIARVVAVSGDTCDVMLGERLRISGVRLRAAQDNAQTGIQVKPSVGSYILIADISEGGKTDFAVVMFSQIDSITINQGNNGGLVNISQLTQKLNNIENDINTLKDIFAGWTPFAQDGGAALKTAAATWAGQRLTTTNDNDYEDDKIKH